MGETKGLVTTDLMVAGRRESGWDQAQSELVGSIINVAQLRGVNKRRFWHTRRPTAAVRGKGSDLDLFLPGLQAGRLAASVGRELRTRCGGVRDLAIAVKHSMSLVYSAGPFRIRSLW